MCLTDSDWRCSSTKACASYELANHNNSNGIRNPDGHQLSYWHHILKLIPSWLNKSLQRSWLFSYDIEYNNNNNTKIIIIFDQESFVNSPIKNIFNLQYIVVALWWLTLYYYDDVVQFACMSQGVYGSNTQTASKLKIFYIGMFTNDSWSKIRLLLSLYYYYYCIQCHMKIVMIVVAI